MFSTSCCGGRFRPSDLGDTGSLVAPVLTVDFVDDVGSVLRFLVQNLNEEIDHDLFV
jgi:hypothetical protein